MAVESVVETTVAVEKPFINGGGRPADDIVVERITTETTINEPSAESAPRTSMPSLDNPVGNSPKVADDVKAEQSEAPQAETPDVVARPPDDIEMADSAPAADKPELGVPSPVITPETESRPVELSIVEAAVSDAPAVETRVVETVVEELPVEPLVVETPAEKTPISKDEAPEQLKVEATPAETSSPYTELPVADAKMAEPVVEKPSPSASPQEADTSMAEADESALPASEADLQPASLSQLNIETTQEDISPTQDAPEVSMSDAPSFKVSREREDDAGEEPAAKRAKTEPEEDEPAAGPSGSESIEVARGANAAGLPEGDLSIASLKWDDAEKDAKAITPFQRREARKVIGRVKKTKNGGNFRDSVQKLWPALWETYAVKIEKPMDLAEIDRTLREPEGPYITFSDLKRDLVLIFANALTFNGPGHDVTASAFNAVKAVWDDVAVIPEEEPPRPKAVPKSKPVRESRAAATTTPTAEPAARRQSAGPIATESSDVKSPSTEKPGELRRASTVDDRPKRTVRAPKPKDIDYSTKPSRKKLKPELQFGDEVLTELMSPKHEALNYVFMDAVDAEGLGIPTYYSVVKKPMDLGKASRMLAAGEFSTLKEFDKAVQLIFENCYKFNGPVSQGNPVSLLAKQLQDVYGGLMKGKDAWLAKHAKANAPSVSNASDEEDEEEEDADGEDVMPAVDYSKEIKELEDKLREEGEKLTKLILDPAPNQSLVKLQQTIVQMVQGELDAKKKESEKKPEKPGKKGGKAAKAKGAGGSKSKAPAAAHPKKTGGTRKPAPKKSLTAADKDEIANAINDLEYPHLDRAIDIIKRDTGQNVSQCGT